MKAISLKYLLSKQIVCVCFVFAQCYFYSFCTVAQNTPSDVSVSPYVIAIEQPDGTKLHIIGKGNQQLAYTETEDGYTILQNKQGVYEYALQAADGNLRLSGLIAKDSIKRTTRENRRLLKISKHLRYTSPYLDIRLKQNNN